jgi:hypothetical protein
MTTIQKAAVTAVIAISFGAGVYEVIRARATQRELQTVQQQNAPLADSLQRLQAENARVTALAQNLQTQNSQLRQQLTELPSLRAEVAALRAASPAKTSPASAADPEFQAFVEVRSQAQRIQQELEQRPQQKIPELALLSDVDWLTVVKEAKFDSEIDIRKIFRHLRSLSKEHLPLAAALDSFSKAEGAANLTDISQLKPFLQAALAPRTLPEESLDAILSRYSLIRTGDIAKIAHDEYIVAEKAPTDKEYDSRAKFGRGRTTVMHTGLNQDNDPDY